MSILSRLWQLRQEVADQRDQKACYPEAHQPLERSQFRLNGLHSATNVCYIRLEGLYIGFGCQVFVCAFDAGEAFSWHRDIAFRFQPDDAFFQGGGRRAPVSLP